MVSVFEGAGGRARIYVSSSIRRAQGTLRGQCSTGMIERLSRFCLARPLAHFEVRFVGASKLASADRRPPTADCRLRQTVVGKPATAVSARARARQSGRRRALSFDFHKLARRALFLAGRQLKASLSRAEPSNAKLPLERVSACSAERPKQ